MRRGEAIHRDVLDNEAVLWHWVQYDGVETLKGEKKKRRGDRRSFSSIVSSHKWDLVSTVVEREESDVLWYNPCDFTFK